MHANGQRIMVALCVCGVVWKIFWDNHLPALFLPRFAEVVGIIAIGLSLALPVLTIRKKIVSALTVIVLTLLTLFVGCPAYYSWSQNLDTPAARQWVTKHFFTSSERVQSFDIDLHRTNAETALWSIFLSFPAVEPERPIPSLDALDAESIKRAEELFDLAAKSGLDQESLRRAWNRIIEENSPNTVLMPSAAFFIKFEGRPAWVITCRWEHREGIGIGDETATSSPIELGHVRAWVRDAATSAELSFTTCM
jgi:hypothetical protein